MKGVNLLSKTHRNDKSNLKPTSSKLPHQASTLHCTPSNMASWTTSTPRKIQQTITPANDFNLSIASDSTLLAAPLELDGLMRF